MQQTLSKCKSQMKALAKGAFSEKSPAAEALSNFYILKDISDLLCPRFHLVIACEGGNIFGGVTCVYSPTTDSWSQCSSMPLGRMDYDVVVSKDRIFIVGGFLCSMDPRLWSESYPYHDFNDSLLSLKFSESGNLAEEWKVEEGMRLKKTRLPFRKGVVVDGKLLVFSKSDFSPEVFQLEERGWRECSLKIGIDAEISPPILVIGRKIYFMGDLGKLVDFETGKEESIPPASHQRYGSHGTVIDDRFIWIIGGISNGRCDTSIEVYDTEQKKWTMLPIKAPFETEAVYMRIASWNRKIFAVCSRQYSMMILDIDEMKWTRAELPEAVRESLHIINFFCI